MSCNCGKGKRPLGSGTSTNTTTAAPKTSGFTLVTPDQKKLSYGSELEVMANQRRFGGTISSF